MKRFVNVVIVAVIGLLLVGAQPFEGTKWKVKVSPDSAASAAGEKPFEDILIFKGGKFTATECAKYGFKPVEYHEEMSPGGFVASFTATQTSEKEGTAKWHGTTTAGEMTGELTWTKADGNELNYTFKGERMPQK